MSSVSNWIPTDSLSRPRIFLMFPRITIASGFSSSGGNSILTGSWIKLFKASLSASAISCSVGWYSQWTPDFYKSVTIARCPVWNDSISSLTISSTLSRGSRRKRFWLMSFGNETTKIGTWTVVSISSSLWKFIDVSVASLTMLFNSSVRPGRNIFSSCRLFLFRVKSNNINSDDTQPM